MKLHEGQKVTITGAAGTVEAEVLHVETPAELPAISGAPEITRVRRILEERGVTQVAMLAHTYDGRPAQFMATGDGAGNWRDLQGQPLTITPGGIQ
jgi:hypothetical protein